MWITLSLAVLTIAVLTLRGRPWHGWVAGTLGVYLLGATWALVAHGTGGFMRTVTAATWWQPALALAAIAFATGYAPLRRRLLGGAAWKRSSAQSKERVSARLEAAPPWQTKLLDRALGGHSDAWAAASELLLDERALAGQLSARGQSESMENRVSGPLGQAISALDACLDSISSERLADGPNLTPSAWSELLCLGHTAADRKQPQDDESSYRWTNADRADLVLRASSHSVDAGLALSWRWFSGFDELLARLGTEEQKESLGWPAEGASETNSHDLIAAGWTGSEREPITARVAREDHGNGEVLGLRVECRLDDVIGADASTLVAVMVPTSDPEGWLGEDASKALGMSCVLIRPGHGLAVLDGSNSAERLGSHSLRGSVDATDVFVDLDHVLGGEAGIGAVDERVASAVNGLQITGRIAVLAGQAQRHAALQGSSAILRNVMNGETIEAWSHADLGSGTLRLTALSRATARALDVRDLTPSEVRAFESSARRIHSELLPEIARDEPILPAFQPRETDTFASGWLPTWYRSSLEAAAKADPGPYELARARGLREWTSSVTRSACAWVIGGKPGMDGESATDVNAWFTSVARAHASLRTAALREPGTDGSPSESAPATSRGSLEAHLSHAEERLTVCVALAVVDRLTGSQPTERALYEFATLSELSQAWTELRAACGALEGRVSRTGCGAALRSTRHIAAEPTPELAETVAASMAATPEVLRRLTSDSYQGHPDNTGTAPIFQASRLAAASRVPIAAIRRAQAVGQLPSEDFESVLDLAVARRIASAADVAKIRACMAVASEFISRSTQETASGSLRRTA